MGTFQGTPQSVSGNQDHRTHDYGGAPKKRKKRGKKKNPRRYADDPLMKAMEAAR